jgi:hypothetical protein
VTGRRHLRALPPPKDAQARKPSTEDRSGRDVAARRARAASPPAAGRLGARAAEIIPLDGERRARALVALTVLYRDFLEAGGLDIARQQRCPQQPAMNHQQRRAA